MHLYLLTHIQLSKKAAVAKTNAELNRAAGLFSPLVSRLLLLRRGGN
jgi:hypothetical protein